MSGHRRRRTRLGDALRRASSELPPGPAAERLRNFCGRAWDLLRAPALAPSRDYDAASTCFKVIQGLLVEGELAREFRSLSPDAIARLLVSSLFARAHWCAFPVGMDAGVLGACSHVVAESLEVLLPAIVQPGSGVDSVGDSLRASAKRERG